MRRFGELEAVIMDRLWDQGRPMLVREMVEALRGDRPLAYTTVMTVMENLHRKGCCGCAHCTPPPVAPPWPKPASSWPAR
jgi:predicted transcriptional regulator